VLLEHVPFFKGVRIEQQFDAFASRQLALLVLAVDTLLAATEAGRFALSSSWWMMSCIYSLQSIIRIVF